jgi:crotonobetainyl-CoA:carnitine CoA-transferase CaiB-like acyl-CoA transferase
MSALSSFLRGIRVIDLSQNLPGPLASLFLRDMGASILKIEPPAGDVYRDVGPRGQDGKPAQFAAVNAGKSIVHLDLKSDAGKATLFKYIEAADILIEGFRPGTMERLGFGIPALRVKHPALICCSLSGYGQDGSLAAGHDANYLAAAGILHGNGTDGPAVYDPPLADASASLFLLAAILGALNGRHSSGAGCHIDLAMADTLMPLQIHHIAAFSAVGAIPRRMRDYANGGLARYHVYRTGDGAYVAVCPIEPKFWQRFCVLAGRPDWIARRNEPTPQTALIAEVQVLIASMGIDECMARFSDPDACVSRILDLSEALVSPQVRSRSLVQAGPDGILQTLFPVKIDGETPSLRPPYATLQPSEPDVWP